MSLFDLFNESKARHFNYTLKNIICDWKHTIWSAPAGLCYEKWREETTMTKSECGSAAFDQIHSRFGFSVQSALFQLLYIWSINETISILTNVSHVKRSPVQLLQSCSGVVWWTCGENEVSISTDVKCHIHDYKSNPKVQIRLWISEDEEQISKTVMCRDQVSVHCKRFSQSFSFFYCFCKNGNHLYQMLKMYFHWFNYFLHDTTSNCKINP